MIGKAKKERGSMGVRGKGAGFEQKILTRRVGYPLSAAFSFQKDAEDPHSPSSKGTFSCVKHASD